MMNNIKYIKGDLFGAPNNSILVHACNAKGRWGSGIAAQFAKKFPQAYDIYKTHCKENSESILGSCILISSRDEYRPDIGCLITSKDYGLNVDSPEQILKATKSAITDLIKKNMSGKEICMCKINSGLFRVPWY